MDEAVLTERLDQAIEALLRSSGAPVEHDDAQVAALLRVAVELRDLPRAEFKAALRNEIGAEISMTTSAAETAVEPAEPQGQPERARFRTITPYLTVADIHEEIDFITRTFGAEGTIFGLGSAGGFHSEYKIGESMVMIGGGGKGSAWKGSPTPAALHIYVKDVDVVYQRALAAGGTSLYAPMDQEYGDRDAAVRDVGGNEWYIGTHKGADYRPADTPDLMPFLHPQGAPAMIDFLKQAFNAEALSIHQSPDGIVRHATVKIGDSIIEMGEAHGEWQPMPMTLMLYVEDVDNWYARAMKAEGTISITSPADQAYGDRMGAVKDPFGNTWYIGQHLATNEDDTTVPERITAMPKLFRIALQVADLDQASDFYGKLLGEPGTRIPRGSRHYFDCGPVILALVDVAKGAGQKPEPTPDYVYFAVNNLDEVFERAKALDCLARDRFHDQNAGEILKRPWGEVSFYVEDPWGNGLCFVDETTLFTGK
jgi:uncharacterized glyoxalase superfamily protein PhnB/catechol 2,3-dioxygenase-like lactoylglutathione lyase family enzyme